MKVFLYKVDAPIIAQTEKLLFEMGVEITNIENCDIAIAPLMKRKLSNGEINLPKIGTLIFHPSLLPVHAGADAIKWVFKLGEAYSGITWFWASEKLDAGDICEQEVLLITPGETPKEYYNRAVIPAAIRALRHALTDIKCGHVRKRAQVIENRTYDKKIVCA